MTIIIPANSAADTAYEVANSCRFNDDDNAYLSRSQVSGDATKFTYSGWFKRGLLSDAQDFLDIYDDNSNRFGFFWSSDDHIDMYNKTGGSTTFQKITTAKFRDVSAWYHVVISADSSLSTAEDRVKLYVNGVRITSFGTNTNISQDASFSIHTSDDTLRVGAYGTSGSHYDGYMAEVVWIDGTAYAQTDFGEFDSDSPTIWKPKDVSGLIFGTNGFYLDFEDSSNLGNDANGGTDLTEVNLAATDQSSDTPTLNYPTFNPLIKGNVATTLSEGNLKGVFGSGWSWLPATFGVQNGKWYWEAKVSATNDANLFIGITTEDQDWDDATPYDEAGTILYFADGRKSVDGTDTESHFASYTTNDIIGVALDLDSGTRTITFYKNNSVTPASSSAVTITSNFTGKFIMPVFVGNSSSAAANWELNFGSPPYANTSDAADANGYGAFEFAPPSGYLALNSANLAEEG